MTLDPLTHLVFVIWLLCWTIIGTVFWVTFHENPPSPGWCAFLVAFGGPCVWALAARKGLAALRRRILAHWGMENWTCCGGCSHDHSDRA